MLPDYLRRNLDLVFVGLNPGEYSDQKRHYFARPINEFWTALNESGLVPEQVGAEDDYRLLEFGIGLTDIVKRPTKNMDDVSDDEFLEGGQQLRAKLLPLAPRVICFVGLSGYQKAFNRKAKPGAQPERWGESHLFILPSTSPRNAYYRGKGVEWFRRLKSYVDEVKRDRR